MVKSERLAVIIASKNRDSDISRALASLGQQTVLADDVVVIDQSDRPYDLAQFPNVRHIYDPSIRSLTAARNRGIDLVSAPRVLFLDDDVALCPGTLSALHVAFDTYADAVGFQCDDLEVPKRGRLQGLIEIVFSHGFFARRRARRGNVIEVTELGGFGMAYRAHVFKNERFDESLVGYSFGEDWDFSKRAAKYGRLIVAPGADLHHFCSAVNRNSARAIYRMRWANYHYFFKKHFARPTLLALAQMQWWKIGETYGWLRHGLGFPSTRKALER